jgi:hypothetical protein
LASRRQATAGLSSLSEYNSLYYILKETKLYSQKLNITQKEGEKESSELDSKYEYNPEILTSLGLILGDHNLRRVSFYTLDVGAVTTRIIQEVLGFNLTAATRAIQSLRDYKIIEPAIPIKRPHGAKGGRRVTVYQTPEATVNQVAQACELQRRLESPKYRLALRYTQILLEEYIEPRHRQEITYVDLLDELKARRVPEVKDVAGFVRDLLRERGIKVWS